MSVAALRKLEVKFLQNDGRISKAEAQELAKAVGSDVSTEEKAFLREVLGQDGFDKGSRATLEKLAGKPKKGDVSTLAGKSYGKPFKQDGKEMLTVVSREISPAAGYDNEWQAQAALRAAGLRTDRGGAVMKDAKGKWHAVETNVAEAKGFTGGKADVKETKFHKMPDPAREAKLATEAKDAYSAYRKSGNDDGMRVKAENAYKALLSEQLGVPESEINVITKLEKADPNKINFRLEHDSKASVITSGKDHIEPLATGSKDKAVRNPPALVFGRDALNHGPEHANGVLLHEATHIADNKRADALLAEWRSGDQKKDFSTWLGAKRKDKTNPLSERDHLAVKELIPLSSGQIGRLHSETNSYTNEFIGTYKAMSPNDKMAFAPLTWINEHTNQLSAEQLKKWKPNAEEAELFGKLNAFYSTLDDAHRAAFDAYLAKVPTGSIMGRYATQRPS